MVQSSLCLESREFFGSFNVHRGALTTVLRLNVPRLWHKPMAVMAHTRPTPSSLSCAWSWLAINGQDTVVHSESLFLIWIVSSLQSILLDSFYRFLTESYQSASQTRTPQNQALSQQQSLSHFSPVRKRGLTYMYRSECSALQ